MIFVTLLSIYIKNMKIDRGLFEIVDFKNILQKSKLIWILMTSSFFTFDFRYDFDIQCIHSLGTGHAHVQISGLSTMK